MSDPYEAALSAARAHLGWTDEYPTPDMQAEYDLPALVRKVLEAADRAAWRPIRTAPKSTSTPTKWGHDVHAVYLLGFCPEEGRTPESCVSVIWWEPHENNGKGCWFCDGGFSVSPTLWRPLPRLLDHADD